MKLHELIIGVDLGGTNIKGALLDKQGSIIIKDQKSTQANAGPEAVARRMSEMISSLEGIAASKGAQVLGIGIGVPGQPNSRLGTVVFAPNLRWRNVPLVKYLHGATGLPIFLENDANMAALGEQWLGAGRGALNMVMITIGTGIGGGLIINGRLYSGGSGTAGEIGHTVIDPNGPLCSCGRRGCLETMTSATAMIRMAREAIDSGEVSVLSKAENLEARDIIRAAQAGDKVADRIINNAAYYLGLGLGNVINLLNPDTIVVGGGVSRAGEILFAPLRANTALHSLESAGQAVKIVPAELGNDAGCIGAAALVRQETSLKK